MNVTLTCEDKQINAIIPDDLGIKQKRKAFYLMGEAMLRDEVEADLRARLASQGFDLDEIRAQNKAMGLN